MEARTKLSTLMKEKDLFLERLKLKNTDFYDYRIQIGDFNYGRRLPGTDKCKLRRSRVLPNGTCYFGEWLIDFDLMQGKGMLIDQQGFLFEGWFINNTIVTGRYMWGDTY